MFLQWILGKPKVCVFFGCIGQDDFGEILVKKAAEDGVDVKYQYSDKQPTGELHSHHLSHM